MSLPEQREAIERYAVRNNLTIIDWFEEQQTAAKRGRPVWAKMLRLLRQGRARGVVIHKIDRSARNLKDWSDLSELSDKGIEVHFANESLDLNSRSGRLSADIQAVVAADYIRNLREEAKKGIYGRLKQGFYPLRAPLGYCDNGAGKSKTIHPQKGPLVRKAFELYATGRFGIDGLVEEMFKRGLRNHAGGKVTRNGIAVLLRNSFYTGLIKIKKNGQNFLGNHAPLISTRLFQDVQDVMAGRLSTRAIRHEFLFSKILRCGTCGYCLIGELQKGRVYYRCQRNECPTVTCIREDAIEATINRRLATLEFTTVEKQALTEGLIELKANWAREREQQVSGLRLKTEKLTERLNRLMDGYLDEAFDKALFEQKKAAILQERLEVNQSIQDLENGRSIPEEVKRIIELAEDAPMLYQNAIPERKRRLVKTLTSNFTACEKNIDFALRKPFLDIANREKCLNGGPSKVISRTCADLLRMVETYLNANPVPVE